MTRMVVAADAEADTNAILTYLAQEAGAAVAARYAQQFRTTIERLVRWPASGAEAGSGRSCPDRCRFAICAYL
jgi:plasmid stabilization system protein ParE